MSSPYDPYGWTRLMQAADAAPSILNTKPWVFDDKLANDRIELRPNWDRHLTVVDPRHRELLISCGAALFNLRMAIRVTGHDLVVWLLPDEQTGGAICTHCGDSCGVGNLLASIEILTRRTHPVTVTEQRLYEAIPQRRTVREPFKRAVPMNVLAELQEMARKEGARARLLFPREIRRLLREAARTDQKFKLDRAYADELRQWTGSNATSDLGVPAAKFGPRPTSHRYPPVRDLSLGWPGAYRDKKKFERPQLIALQTESDKALDWMRVGQALQRLLLRATYYQVQASFLTQQLEGKDGKLPPLQSIQQWWRWPESPQMIIRLGEA